MIFDIETTEGGDKVGWKALEHIPDHFSKQTSKILAKQAGKEKTEKIEKREAIWIS